MIAGRTVGRGLQLDVSSNRLPEGRAGCHGVVSVFHARRVGVPLRHLTCWSANARQLPRNTIERRLLAKSHQRGAGAYFDVARLITCLGVFLLTIGSGLSLAWRCRRTRGADKPPPPALRGVTTGFKCRADSTCRWWRRGRPAAATQSRCRRAGLCSKGSKSASESAKSGRQHII